MSKNKSVIISVMALVLGVVLLASSSAQIEKAFAADLTAGTVNITLEQKEKDVQKQITVFMKKDGYTNILKWETKLLNEKIKFISTTKEYKETWNKYLTKKQKNKLVKNLNKVLHSYRLSTIAKYKDKSAAIADKASTLKETKTNVKNFIKSYPKKNKNILTKEEQQQIQNLKNKVKKSYSIKNINSYKLKVEEIVLKAQERKEAEEKAAKEKAEEEEKPARAKQIPYDVSSWSNEKIEYVLVWGPKNNSFLAGTPMEGLGWYIAAGAYDYNVDPALLSSIAYVESKCGSYPYGSPYNAYGWICMNPEMYGWEDGIDKWYAFFADYFGGDIPVSSMHGYGGYGVDSIYPYLEEIRNT